MSLGNLLLTITLFLCVLSRYLGFSYRDLEFLVGGSAFAKKLFGRAIAVDGCALAH